MILLSALTHHGEPGDPVLLQWINDQINAILGLGDFAMVAILGAAVIAIPIGIFGFLALQRLRGWN
ncbi:MAG: hypothetical protein J4G14_06570 [Dehalococcoidia bacterium]|nr:hypothetical protein [Dehalococcoidia bacterium]